MSVTSIIFLLPLGHPSILRSKNIMLRIKFICNWSFLCKNTNQRIYPIIIQRRPWNSKAYNHSESEWTHWEWRWRSDRTSVSRAAGIIMFFMKSTQKMVECFSKTCRKSAWTWTCTVNRLSYSKALSKMPNLSGSIRKFWKNKKLKS